VPGWHGHCAASADAVKAGAGAAEEEPARGPRGWVGVGDMCGGRGDRVPACQTRATRWLAPPRSGRPPSAAAVAHCHRRRVSCCMMQPERQRPRPRPRTRAAGARVRRRRRGGGAGPKRTRGDRAHAAAAARPRRRRIVCFRGMPHRGLVSMGPDHPIERGSRYSLDADLDERGPR